MYLNRDLEDIYKDDASRAKIIQLFALSQLFGRGVRVSQFTVSNSLDSAIVANPEGQTLLEQLYAQNTRAIPSAAKFALFLTFGHTRLLIDLERTDGAAIEGELAAYFDTGQIKYPWIYGHALYDTAFKFSEIREELSVAQCDELLAVAPGVFQIGNYVVGPLGLRRSAEQRFVPARLDLPLWHCSNPSCSGIHSASLSQLDKAHRALHLQLDTILNRQEGVISNWFAFFRALIFGGSSWYYDDFSRIELPWFVGNVFSETELRAICSRLIEQHGGNFRPQFSADSKYKNLWRGSASEIAARMTNGQALQIILLALDEDILAAIDGCIDASEISIPSTEVRRARVAFPYLNWAYAHFECSRLGTRVVGSDENTNPNARLKRLLLAIQKNEADISQLQWRLRSAQGTSMGEKIENLILAETPTEIVKQLVFASEEKLRAALQHIRAPHLSISGFDEAKLRTKLLWRLGFDQSEFESEMNTFDSALAEFRAVANGLSGAKGWKERVRSIGVNVFVYLEEALDRTLCFSTWLLLADHFAANHSYDPQEARKLVVAELNGIVEGKEGPIVFDVSGKNELFTLISGLSALQLRCEAIMNEPPSKYQRHTDSWPHYYTPRTVQLFPYRHRMFVLDLSPEDRTACLGILKKAYSILMQGTAMTIRNRIDHSSGNFPSPNEVIECCDALKGIGQELTEFGLFPTVYGISKVEIDSFDRRKVRSRDYNGHEIVWTLSPVLHALRSLPSLSKPQIIVPRVRIPDTAEPVRFGLRENSEFQNLWANYPKRRPTPSLVLLGSQGSSINSDDTGGSELADVKQRTRRKSPSVH